MALMNLVSPLPKALHRCINKQPAHQFCVWNSEIYSSQF